jgi:hypothetical protein
MEKERNKRKIINKSISIKSYLTYDYYSSDGSNHSKPRCVRKGGSAEICPGGLMTTWVYDKKFLTDVRFLF